MVFSQSTKKKKSMELKDVAELLSGIATPWSLYLVPINLDQEKEKFFSSVDYNPVFKYRKPKAIRANNNIFNQLSNLTEISDVDPEISKYIIKVIEHKKQASELLDSIGKDEEFVDVSKDRFGEPNYSLFKKACKILRGRYGDISIAKRDDKLRTKYLEIDEVMNVFRTVFKVIGLKDWTVEKSKAIISSGFRTVVKTRRVMVDPNVKVSAEKLRKTIVHEVLTHALRGENGFATGFDVFGKPNLAEYVDDEEGLALYNEEIFGLLRDIDIRMRAAYVYAAYLGKELSFRDVFNSLRGIYPKNTAFNITYRTKRGLSDTSKSGCYYKDIVYLRGFLDIRRKLESDSSSYRNMYAGKIPFSYLYLVEEGILPKPKIIPNKELVERIFKECKLV